MKRAVAAVAAVATVSAGGVAQATPRHHQRHRLHGHATASNQWYEVTVSARRAWDLRLYARHGWVSLAEDSDSSRVDLADTGDGPTALRAPMPPGRYRFVVYAKQSWTVSVPGAVHARARLWDGEGPVEAGTTLGAVRAVETPCGSTRVVYGRRDGVTYHLTDVTTPGPYMTTMRLTAHTDPGVRLARQVGSGWHRLTRRTATFEYHPANSTVVCDE